MIHIFHHFKIKIFFWYFNPVELKKRIPDITEKMLSLQLRALEADGIILRQVYGTKPPVKVEYSLTEFGKTLVPALNAIAKWGRELGESKGGLVEPEN